MQSFRSTLGSWAKFLVWRTSKIRPSRYSSEDWNREYTSGLWKRLEDMDELGHYSVIAGYAGSVAPRTLLDIGCGHGVLAGHLKIIPYQRYLGIDLSEQAVNEASRRHGDQRTFFEAFDAREFRSDQFFDLIIFNECLYYLGTPRETIRSYSMLLAPGGKMIVSMWTACETRAIWPEVHASMRVEDAVTIRNHRSGIGWTVKLLSRPGTDG
jgi:2-polyprenyl-3-methyl-5-hydroxy-6-metoxy-1,4-benzoquinol methylase